MTKEYYSRQLKIAVAVVMIVLINSCSSENEPEPVDCSVNPVTIENTTSSTATCGVNDGSLTVTASGGSGNYTYSINGEDFQSENTFENLQAGNYSVTVMDMNECTASVQVTIESEAGMIITAENTAEAGCGTSMGEITVDVSGGASPYQYKTEQSSFQNDNTLANLAAGEYTVVAQEANGCEITTTVTVLSGTSLEDDVMPILTTNCAISGCHDGNSGLPDWSDKTSVISNAGNIKNRTGDGSMPPGGRSITDEEIQTIACWVDDGAPDN